MLTDRSFYRSHAVLGVLAVFLFASVAAAQFSRTVVSASQCLLQQVEMRQGGLDMVLLEHGSYQGQAKSLFQLTNNNIETFWGGKLVVARPAAPYLVLVWKKVRIYGVISMVIDTRDPYTFCTFTPRGDREVRVMLP